MKYLVRDCDPNTGEPDDDGYDDEYVVRYNCTSKQTIKTKSFVHFHHCKMIFCFPVLVLPSFLFVLLRSALHQLEDLEVTVADHIQKVLKPNFGAAWEEVGDEFEKEETFALASVRTLDGTQAARNLGRNHECTKVKHQGGLRHKVS